jgi:hypothetical protein
MAISARLRASAGSDFVRAEPAIRKVLRRKRVDDGDRDLPAAQVGCERHPVMTGGLHRDKGHRLRLSLEPGVEDGEAGSVLADPEELAISGAADGGSIEHLVLPLLLCGSNRSRIV